MVDIRFADINDMEELMRIRFEMLREVNSLPEDHVFSDELVESSKEYFASGDGATVLAMDGGHAVACASLSFINVMPTYDHPSGKRAHLMNVYTAPSHRRQGLARKMVLMLTAVALSRGVTEISLDSTESGRPFYESLNFGANNAAMNLVLKASGHN